MKYQVGFFYTYEGEYSVEADSIEEAKELLRDLTFGDPFNDPDIDGNSTLQIIEVYEWDEAAQEKARKDIEKTMEKVLGDIEARKALEVSE